MSDCVRAMVWTHYSEKRFGAPLILAIALSDEADDRGGGIFQSLSKLAGKTRQSERAVRAQMRRMEASGVLECVEKSAGGAGKFSHYRINMPVLMGLENPERASGLTRKPVPGYSTENPERASGLFGQPYKELKDTSKEHSTAGLDAEDRRLAEWMLDTIRKFNPQHRDPSWAAWMKDIRLMRVRDQKTHREMGELFRWASADSFWQSNILSPGALRKQWDKLTIQRKARGSNGAQAPAQASDRGCSRVVGGKRCGTAARFFDRLGKGLCQACRDEVEREPAQRNAIPQGATA